MLLGIGIAMVAALFVGLFIGGAALEAQFTSWRRGFTGMAIVYGVTAVIVGFLGVASWFITEGIS